MGTVTAIFGKHDENTLQQFMDVASRAAYAAIMADGHHGYVMPIGGVAAYRNQISVVGVGFDIACGNAAIKTDMTLEQLCGLELADIQSNPYAALSNVRLNELADEIASTLSFGIGRKNESDDAPVNDHLFNDPAWGAIPQKIKTDVRTGFRDSLRDTARKQLGTIGSGNHYVDVFVDDENYLWVGVHFGSRGLGHKIATAYNAIAQGGEWGDKAAEKEVLLDLSQPTGHDYWQLMELAGRYAYVGREWVARKVVQLLGAQERDLIHNHHNFAWREMHFAEELVVVRKGATPAFPEQRGFVGGSMGDQSVVLQGTNPLYATTAPGMFGSAARGQYDEIVAAQKSALYSTVHGAGRVMSRTAAAGKRYRSGKKAGQLKKDTNGHVINAGSISKQMMAKWLREQGVILRGGGRDESPHVYRRLPEVLQAQGGTIEVLKTLHPLVVCMAGEDEHDPYKD